MRYSCEDLQMCEKIAEAEGCELGDAIISLCDAVSVLRGISADHEANLAMLACKKLCVDYCDMGRNRELDYSYYEFIPEDAYSYFLGGARKLTEEQYEKH